MSYFSAGLAFWVAHDAAPMKSGSGTSVPWVDFAETLIPSLAVIIGGVFAYFKFVRGRIFRPRVKIKLSAQWQNIDNKQWLLARIHVKNIGASKILLSQRGTGLRVSVPAQQQPPPPAAAKWDSRGLRSILKQHSWIESKEMVSDDLLLDLGTDPVPVLLEGYLVISRRLFRDIETSARQVVVPANAALSPLQQ